MRYRFEYNGNPEYVTLHLSEKISEGYVSEMTDRGTEKEKQLILLVKGCEGVVNTLSGISLREYSITVGVGQCFEREDVLNNLLETVKMWFSLQGLETEWTQLPTLRKDIEQMQCPGCKALQEEELRKWN